jgi:type II secretory pathway component PulJ
MKITKARYNGFILLEVLVSLSILGMAMALLWDARVNQSLFDQELHKRFATDRLTHDSEILLELKMSNKLLKYGYGKYQN